MSAFTVQTPYMFTQTKSMRSIQSSDNFLPSNLVQISPISPNKPDISIVYSNSLKRHLILKNYQTMAGSPSPYFMNEVRHQVIQHPNLIRIIDSRQKRIDNDQENTQVSSCLIELAKYGDLASHFMTGNIKPSEKLARTFFRNIVEGLGYLHENNICHLDIKLGNLLLADNFEVKICDFEFSFQKGDTMVLGCCTKNFRPPEVLKKEPIRSLKAIDIYSLGVVMFAMSVGSVPYDEEKKVNGIDLMALLHDDIAAYWKVMEKLMVHKVSNTFKNLFEWMTRADFEERPSIDEIKGSDWYNEDVYTQEELNNLLKASVRSLV